jgi:membrane protein implicated in regulation of membrane protease activity
MTEWSSASVLWFVLGLVCMLAEFLIPGFIVIFFGVGAWVTALCLWAGWVTEFDTQLLIFLVSTVLSLVLFRRQGKRMFGGKISGEMKPGDDLEDLRGARAVAATDIVPQSLKNKVEFRGTLWEADAETPIAKGTVVEILARDNLTLHVQPLKDKGS